MDAIVVHRASVAIEDEDENDNMEENMKKSNVTELYAMCSSTRY